MTAKREVLVHLQGGFANQLFQWATSRLLADAYDADLILDARLLSRPGEREFALDKLELVPESSQRKATRGSEISWNLLHRILPKRAFIHLSHHLRPARFGKTCSHYDEAAAAFEDGRRSVRFDGYLQDVQRLSANRKSLVEQLRGAFAEVSVMLPDAPYNAVHVRRGDYVSSTLNSEQFGICDHIYFNRAVMEVFDDKLPIFVTTDDHPWVQNNLECVMGGQGQVFGSDQFSDLWLLANAEALILSNSTFSWWAGFISSSENVICPDPWTEDGRVSIALDGWERMAKNAAAR